MISRWVIRHLSYMEPERRRSWAARILIASVCGHITSHVVLTLQHAGFFEHVLMFISWGAIELTCVDILCTTDVKVDTAS